MALTYLPKLPDGLHPFYCIFYWKELLHITSADSPLKVNGYYGNHFTNAITHQRWDKGKKQWVKGEERYGNTPVSPDSGDSFIYTNHDIYFDKTLYCRKSSEATEINIDGGDMRNMQKGMVWNVGEAISISPPEAPQICTFSSSNPDVCTVDETGKIVAVGEGECIITITSKM